MSNEIIDEIRKFREAYAERFGYDIRAISRDLNERARLSGRVVVSLPPKRVDPATGLPIAAADLPSIPDPEPDFAKP